MSPSPALGEALRQLAEPGLPWPERRDRVLADLGGDPAVAEHVAWLDEQEESEREAWLAEQLRYAAGAPEADAAYAPQAEAAPEWQWDEQYARWYRWDAARGEYEFAAAEETAESAAAPVLDAEEQALLVSAAVEPAIGVYEQAVRELAAQGVDVAELLAGVDVPALLTDLVVAEIVRQSAEVGA